MAIRQKGHTELEVKYRLLALERLEQIREWRNIDSTLREEIVRDFSAMLDPLVPKLDKARHVLNARKLLGYGNFADANRVFGAGLKKAYRLISMAEKIYGGLPESVLALAPSDFGGIDPERPYGDYQDAIESTPLPEIVNERSARRWWEIVVEKMAKDRAERHMGKVRPISNVTRDLFKEFMKRMRLIDEGQRVEVTKVVIGMVLTELSIDDRIWIDPVAVPSTFKKKRGRPPGKSSRGDLRVTATRTRSL